MNYSGGNGRMKRIQGLGGMAQAKPGGLILPPAAQAAKAAEEARQAQERIAKFQPHFLYWCPTAGAQEVPYDTPVNKGPSPVPEPIQTPDGVQWMCPEVLWWKCPFCHKGHHVVVSMAPRTDWPDGQDEPAVAGPQIDPV